VQFVLRGHSRPTLAFSNSGAKGALRVPFFPSEDSAELGSGHIIHVEVPPVENDAADKGASSKTPGNPLPDASDFTSTQNAVLTHAHMTARVDARNEQTISGSLLRATT
jgi:hypothetical protein